MGLSDVVNALNTVATGATAVNTIKEVGKSMHSDVAKAVGKPSGRKPISINPIGNVKVGEPVTVSGTGVGMVTLYSDGVVIRELFPDKQGFWASREYFGKAGKYVIKATDYYGSAKTDVNATD